MTGRAMALAATITVNPTTDENTDDGDCSPVNQD